MRYFNGPLAALAVAAISAAGAAENAYPIRPIRLISPFAPGGGNDTMACAVGSELGVELVHVPYKGTGPATIDLLAGHLSLNFGNSVAVLPHVKTGRLKAIAVTSLKRAPALPEIPAIAETLPGFEALSWCGIVGPARMPKDITNKLSREITQVLSRPDMKERFEVQGVEPHATAPEEFAAFIRSELAKWAKVVKSSGAQVD